VAEEKLLGFWVH